MKRTGVFAAAAITGIVSVIGATSGVAQAQELVRFHGHTYKSPDLNLTWTGAVAWCANDGGHLVTVNSPAEDKFVYGLNPNTYLGATDATIEGKWVWITGEPFAYKNWDTGQPDSNPTLGEQDYAAYASYEWATPGTWDDLEDFGGHQEFVCEYEVRKGVRPNS